MNRSVAYQRSIFPRSLKVATAASVVVVLVSFGCAKREDPTVAPGDSNPSSRNPPVFGRASGLVEADSRTCDMNEYATDDDSFVVAIGKTPLQIAADADVGYQTVLRWDTIVPPFNNLADQETLDVALSYSGTARLYPKCRNLVELDMQLALRSQSGVLTFDGPATLSYSGPNVYRVRTTLAPTTMGEWMETLQNVTLQEPVDFALDLDLGQVGAGNFLVNGPGGATCRLATWPPQRLCELGELAVLSNEEHLGLHTQDVVTQVRDLETVYTIEWDDTGVAGPMTVEFVPDSSGLACVLPIGIGVDGQQQVMYSVLGSVHLATADNRLDVTLPTRARTRGGEGGWSTVELFTAPLVIPASGFGIVPVELSNPQDRAVVSFSTPQEPITSTSRRLRGGLDVQVLALHSSRANPATSSCIAANFFGVVSDQLTSASYLSEP